MSQSASQAAEFYREVAGTREVWTIRDAGGFPAPMTQSGVRSQPFWSSRSRAQKVIASVPAYAGFEPFRIAWADFTARWVPGLKRDGILVGVNWSGPRAVGYDVEPEALQRNVEARLPGAAPALTSTDSWVLTAILVASRQVSPPTLAAIIAAADYLNHAVLTRGELETSIGRLVAAGRLRPGAGGFSPDEATNAFWNSLAGDARTAAGAVQAVGRFIGAQELKSGDLPDTDSEEHVPRAAYEAAVEEYLRKMGRAQ